MKISTRFFICVALFAMGVIASLLQPQPQPLNEMLLNDIEALTQESGSETELTCYCALMSDASCAVNNNGSSLCASGANVKCWEYNNNCN